MLFQIGGKTPNIALMRIASHHRQLGHEVELRTHVTHHFWDKPDYVYASVIFDKHKGLAAELKSHYRGAIIGGTGWSFDTLEMYGIETLEQDYSIYPEFRQSIGFTQRGCRLKCSFCVVPRKEGGIRETTTIQELWRGDPWPRELLLLDNDFFGQPHWRDRIAEIQDGGFKVSFNQGINARFLTDEAAEAVASVDYRDDSMKVKRIYTAWDSLKDEDRLFEGLSRLVRYGVKPDHIMVYMLCGYWPGETQEDREHRRSRLREFGARPYPMPFVRTPELVGFQRWVVGAYDKRVTWDDWQSNSYRPEGIGVKTAGGLWSEHLEIGAEENVV